MMAIMVAMYPLPQWKRMPNEPNLFAIIQQCWRKIMPEITAEHARQMKAHIESELMRSHYDQGLKNISYLADRLIIRFAEELSWNKLNGCPDDDLVYLQRIAREIKTEARKVHDDSTAFTDQLITSRSRTV
jgi:hypothetical protein